MVSTKSNDSRQRLFLLGGSLFECISHRGTRQDAVVAFFNLLKGIGVVVGSDWDITTVEDSGPAVERVCGERDIVSSTIVVSIECGGTNVDDILKVESSRSLSNTRGSEPSTRSVRRASVKRSA